MQSLLAIDLALGPSLELALRECAARGQPFCILDQRLSPRRRDEELAELRLAYKNNDQDNIQEELGDLIFVVAQLARLSSFEAETIARGANRKFEDRFEKMLKVANERKLDFKIY